MMRVVRHHAGRPWATYGGILLAAQREIRTLGVRERAVVGAPMEWRYYQKYTNNPVKYGGPQWNTHFDHYYKMRDHNRRGYVDYINWGKETGQAHLPLRHQRVTFDHYDTMHPTAMPNYARPSGWTQGQDPSGAPLRDVAADFDANMRPYTPVMEWNQRFTSRTVGEGAISLHKTFDSQAMTNHLASWASSGTAEEFGNALVTPNEGSPKFPAMSVPGIHRPFLGEQDTQHMQAMSQPCDGTRNEVTEIAARFSKHLFLNRPTHNNALTADTCRALEGEIDRTTTAIHTKLAVLTAAQSGETDCFSTGLDLELLAYYRRMRNARLADAEAIDTAAAVGNVARKAADHRKAALISEADAYRDRADDMLRSGVALLWRVFSAQRPLMTLINGRCSNVGVGMALLSRYPALRDSSEFSCDGVERGLTPFGGMTHLLARTETTLKYPGLAEFTMLTGTPLYAGDALRLGWSDLYSSLQDVNHHIRTWFDDSEHMHNDAVAWQLGHLLETCFNMKEHHSTSLERSALTVTRSRWIEDAFADQASVEAVLATLQQMEQVPLDDASNTRDENRNTAASLASVAEGVSKLRQHKLSFALAPWDVSAPPEELGVEAQNLAEIFREFYFVRARKGHTVRHSKAGQLAKWKAFRHAEYEAYRRNRGAAQPRHVFVRLAGCENRVVDFEYDFDRARCVAGMDPRDEDALRTAVLDDLSRQVNAALGWDANRGVALQWQLPTLDTATVCRDGELFDMLHADPGVEHPDYPTERPPLHLVAVRTDLAMSEWAYAVRHQLLLSCPMALKATWALLEAVRGDGAEESVKSVSESLALEFRYASRLSQRDDFARVGSPSQRTADDWEERELKAANVVNEAVEPLRSDVTFDDVFERDVAIDGHFFKLRPKWSPRTVGEVSDEEVAKLGTPLSYTADGVTEVHAPTEANMAGRVADSVLQDIGYEVVANLADRRAEKDSPQYVAPLESDVHVPRNVNFYAMARHPFKDQETSWRSHGFTDGSLAYFEKKYKEAAKRVYDPDDRGAHVYWARENTAAATSGPEPEETLLQDRFWGAVREATTSVDQWAREARANAEAGKLTHTTELATSEEKIYDDHYYRWFIRSGQNPNPTGVVRPSATGKSAE